MRRQGNHSNQSDDYPDGQTGAMSQAVKIDTARRYLARGWSLLPLRSHDKRPLVAWEPLQSSHPSAEQVADWFGRWPDANIGIVTGEISNLIVLDIDPKHGGDASLDRLERQFGQLPATIEVTTGGGGHHFYFAHPGGLIRRRPGLAQGVDLRGDGGYIVAPPSIHPSGHPYLWAVGHSPEDVALAALPRWLLLESGGIRARRTPSDWRRLVREGVPEGQRNSSIAALTGHLLWHQVDPEVVLELLLSWNRMRCRPPLEDAEVAQVVSNIIRLHFNENSGMASDDLHSIPAHRAGGR